MAAQPRRIEFSFGKTTPSGLARGSEFFFASFPDASREALRQLP